MVKIIARSGGGGGGVVLGGGPELELKPEKAVVVEAACVLAVAGGGACPFLAPAGLPSASDPPRAVCAVAQHTRSDGAILGLANRRVVRQPEGAVRRGVESREEARLQPQRRGAHVIEGRQDALQLAVVALGHVGELRSMRRVCPARRPTARAARAARSSPLSRRGLPRRCRRTSCPPATRTRRPGTCSLRCCLPYGPWLYCIFASRSCSKNALAPPSIASMSC